MIKLQNLTPEIYYKHSRDFQFIGRLYDIVLNSVKTNAEMLYNIPLNDNTDERLIDLMTTTLGFKSKHNYNIKQLTSLCSAFTEIIKNKGSILAIYTAGQALLNAEGISEGIRYTFELDESEKQLPTINIFISQELTDINLFRDMLVYILPAGMSCNLIHELRVSKEAATYLGTNDTCTIYEGITESGHHVPADSNAKSIIIRPTESGISFNASNAKSTFGLLANSGVYQLESGTTNITYNITYITNGGKINNTATTKYSFKVGDTITLPTVTKAGTLYSTWVYKGTEYTGNLTITEANNIILTLKIN